MNLIRRISIILIVIMAFSLTSCSWLKKNPPVAFSIEMTLGDYLDIGDRFDEEFTLASSDRSVISVMSGTVLNAVGVGETVITVDKREPVSIPVTVKYAPTALSISCASPLYTSVKGTTMDFFVSHGENADETQTVDWFVDGAKKGAGTKFTLTLGEYKNYEVTAKVGDQTCSVNAVCAEPITEPPVLTLSEQEVTLPCGEVEFTLEYDYAVEPYIIWNIDGVPFVGGKTYSFTPTHAGIYTVFASVNGLVTQEKTLTVGGAATPTDVRIDFDSDYPNIWLCWTDSVDTEYEVKVGDTVYGSYVKRMGKEKFDLTGLIDLSAPMEISLYAKGNDIFEPASINITAPVVSAEAKEYLAEKYFGGNYYMTSDEEINDIVEYIMMFRPSQDKAAFSVYMGYSSEMTPAVLLSKAWKYAEQTGTYGLSASGGSSENEIMNVEITFFTGNEPVVTDVGLQSAYPSLVTPEFESGLTQFAVETKEKAEVSTSDQLFYVVQNGFCPAPKSGSAASRIYDRAKNVLSKIIPAQCNDERKVRAIYDWIMWNTTYDYASATIGDVNEAVYSPAYYLEGVFDIGFAVCDGIAKAMSLMCNMVGVPCMRVVGYVSSQHHAWNKVMVDGKWYVVDATWSDGRVKVGETTYEGALHSYFLKSDGEMNTHKPTSPQIPSANDIYDWYGRERESSFGTYSLYVRTDSTDELLRTISGASEKIKFTLNYGNMTIERTVYCMEIRFSSVAKTNYILNQKEITALFPIEYEFTTLWSGDILLIIIKKPT